jgi:transcriptional regulator with XRE-family HTH domain
MNTKVRSLQNAGSSHPALAGSRPDKLAVKSLREDLGLSRKQFARLTGASERAVAGWEKDQSMSPVVRKSLRESERLCRALGTIMKPEFVGAWLDTPNGAFAGLKPLDLIERGETDRLWRMIFEVQSGSLV